jgi:hypothetical protein
MTFTRDNFGVVHTADKAEDATIQFGETSDVNFAWMKVTTSWIKRPVVFASPATANSPDPCVVQVRRAGVCFVAWSRMMVPSRVV